MALSSGSAAKVALSEDCVGALPAGDEDVLMRMYTSLQGTSICRGLSIFCCD